MIPKVITDNGACKGMSPDEFYSSSYTPHSEDTVVPLPADHICHRCPVEQECREWGLKQEAYGTWGGLTEHELYYMRQKLGMRQPSTVRVGALEARKEFR